MKTNKLCIFVSSDDFEGKSKTLKRLEKLVEDMGLTKKQIIILTNLEDDIRIAPVYPECDFMICNKPDEEKTKLEDRFKSALRFIELNKIEDYLLILDK